MTRGKFIVLEGIDGSGKGTAGKMLSGYLFDRQKSNHLFMTREPYDSPYLAEIRKLLKETSDPKENARQLAELFVKDRRMHAAVIECHLSEGTHVICDRYKHSTLVFQQAQGLSFEELMQMHEGVLIPDLTIILDVPEDVALKRILGDSARTHLEVFERSEFLKKLRELYLALPAQLPDERIVIVDGDGTPEAVFARVRAEVDRVFANNAN